LDLGEKTPQPLRRNVALNVFRIKACASFGNTGVTDIRSEKLNRRLRRFIAKKFKQGYGHRVGFFAGGAARSPDANRRFRTLVAPDVWKYVGFQRVKNFWIPEEARNINEHVLVKGFDFGRIRLYVFDVVIEFLDLVDNHATLNSSQNRRLTIMSEVQSSRSAQ